MVARGLQSAIGTSTADPALGSPLFAQAVVTLPSGKTLTIDGNGAADNAPYVQSLTWNGSAWDDAYAPAGAITSGGTLDFTLGTAPDTSWASAPSQAPPSYGGDVVAPPEPRTGPVTSVNASTCLDDPGYDTADGTKLDIWTCAGTSNERWTLPS